MGEALVGLLVGLILGFPFGRLVERAGRAGGGSASGGEQKGPFDELKKGAKVVLIFVLAFAALAVAARRER